MTKEDIIKELENVSTIYVVGITKGTNPNWDKGIWRTFRLFYTDKNNNMVRIDGNSDIPNWNYKKNLFESKALGMDRMFEITYNLSHYLYGNGDKLKHQFLSY